MAILTARHHDYNSTCEDARCERAVEVLRPHHLTIHHPRPLDALTGERYGCVSAMSACMAVALLYVAVVCTIRVRHNPQDRPDCAADAVKVTKARNRSLAGAALFGAVAIAMLIVWAV